MLCSCTPKLPTLNNGISRNDRLETTIPNRTDSTFIPMPGHGTSVWISGVEYPSEHDWRADLLHETSSASIFLMCDGKKVFSMPARASKKTTSEPNKHLFMENALYSEYCDTSGTYLLRNGQVYAHFQGQWRLVGLMVKGDVVHSLWKAQVGRKTMLAEDGITMWSKPSSEPIGSLTSAPFWPTGALYESREKICFGYLADDATFHLVRDGTDETVMRDAGIAQIYDARVIDGKSTAIYSRMDGSIYLRHGATETKIKELDEVRRIGLQEISLFENAGRPWFMCTYSLDYGLEYCSVWDAERMVASKFYRNQAYLSNGLLTLLGPNKSGGLCYLSPDGSIVDIDIQCYWFSWRCACVHAGHTYIALTPRKKGKPSICVDGELTEIPVNGFLTGVYVADY